MNVNHLVTFKVFIISFIDASSFLSMLSSPATIRAFYFSLFLFRFYLCKIIDIDFMRRLYVCYFTRQL